MLSFLLLGLFLSHGDRHRRRLRYSFVTRKNEVTQDRVVKLECAFDFFDYREITLNVEKSIMRFVNFVDRMRELTTAPIFAAVNNTAGFGHHALVFLYHGRNLFALVRMNQKYYFVMPH